jgi:flavin-binding protein dodecin
MTDHIYKSIELTGSSTTGIEDAVNRAVEKASKTIHKLRWFKVTEIRGEIDSGRVKHWQVTIKVSFTLDG